MNYKAKIINTEKIHDAAYFLKLEKPAGFKFEPGQFITITARINDENITRAYSIASLPTEDFLLFYIKIVPNGLMTNYLYKQAKGSVLQIQGPFGVLTPEHIGTNFNNLVFVVAGSGIAPVRPLVWWYKSHANINLVVVHQERYKDLLVFSDFFTQEGVEYLPILSREHVEKVRFGHFQDYLTEIKRPNAKYFVIGPVGFVEAALKEFGKENTLVEKW